VCVCVFCIQQRNRGENKKRPEKEGKSKKKRPVFRKALTGLLRDAENTWRRREGEKLWGGGERERTERDAVVKVVFLPSGRNPVISSSVVNCAKPS